MCDVIKYCRQYPYLSKRILIHYYIEKEKASGADIESVIVMHSPHLGHLICAAENAMRLIIHSDEKLPLLLCISLEGSNLRSTQRPVWLIRDVQYEIARRYIVLCAISRISQ